MAGAEEGNQVSVNTANVSGPPLKEHLSFLIDAQPTVLYVDGPMTHMPENYPDVHTKRSLSHLNRILRTTNIRTLILDHHILVLTAAEFRGDRVDQLEANRDRLYGIESPSPKGISGA